MKKKRIPIRKWHMYVFVHFRKKLRVTEHVVTENETHGKSLCFKLIKHEDSVLRVCPRTFKRYLKNKKLGVSFIINGYSIDFFDAHLHTIEFSDRNYRAILRVFDYYASLDREKLEAEIRADVKHSFESMCLNIDKKISKNKHQGYGRRN